jgi:hypothetical protein
VVDGKRRCHHGVIGSFGREAFFFLSLKIVVDGMRSFGKMPL